MTIMRTYWMKFFTLLLAVFMTVPLINTGQNAEAQIYMGRRGYVEFVSEAMKEDVIGKSNHLNGRIDTESREVDFFVDLTTLKTGIDLRDEHMNENYLETHKYPFAEFFGKLQDELVSASGEPQDVTVKGDFTVHGVTRQITVTGTVTPTEEGIRIEASWDLKLDDYNIPIPKVLTYRLSNDITINIDIKMKERSL